MRTANRGKKARQAINRKPSKKQKQKNQRRQEQQDRNLAYQSRPRYC